jgi:hypothetical protein
MLRCERAAGGKCKNWWFGPKRGTSVGPEWAGKGLARTAARDAFVRVSPAFPFGRFTFPLRTGSKNLHSALLTRVPRARGRVRPVKPGETVQHQGTVRTTAWRVRLTANSSEVCHTLRMCCMRSSYRASLESFVIHEALLVLLK